MKDFRVLVCAMLVAFFAFTGLGTATAADSVADRFNSYRNANSQPSIASDAHLNALAQRAAENRMPVTSEQLQAGWRGWAFLDGSGPDVEAVLNDMKAGEASSIMLKAGWTRMGTGQAVIDGVVYVVIVVATYAPPAPAQVPAPAPAPVNQAPAPAPVPAPAPAPVNQAPTPEPVPEEESQPAVEEEKGEPMEDVQPTPSPTPTTTASPGPSPEPEATKEAVVASSNMDDENGSDMRIMAHTASGYASIVLTVIALLAVLMFMRHRKLGTDNEMEDAVS